MTAPSDGTDPLHISLTYLFTNVRVMSLQHAGSDGLSELVSFAYKALEMYYTPQTANASLKTIPQARWDVEDDRRLDGGFGMNK